MKRSRETTYERASELVLSLIEGSIFEVWFLATGRFNFTGSDLHLLGGACEIGTVGHAYNHFHLWSVMVIKHAEVDRWPHLISTSGC